MAEEDKKKDGNEEGKGDSKDATAKNQIYIKIAEKIKGNNLWWFLLIIIIIAIVLWYFDLLKVTFIWLAGISYVVFLIWGLISGIQEGDSTKIFISLALIIWLIDLLPSTTPLIGPILGNPYAGFKFDLEGTLNTNWLAVLSSGIVFLFLFVNMIKKIIEKEVWGFILCFTLIVLTNNYLSNAFGVSNFSIQYGNYIILGMIISGFILAVFLNKKFNISEIPDFASYFFMVLVFSFFWVNSGWVGNFRAIMHALFIVTFGLFYIAGKEKDNPVAWHILVPLLLIIDFYGYGLLNTSQNLILKFIPIFLIFVIFYCYYKTESTFALGAFIILVIVFLIFSVNAYGYGTGDLQYESLEGAAYTEFLNKFYSNIRNIGAGIRENIELRLENATGGFYRSKVENNQYEPLGVYFSDVKASQPRFYTDEAVTLWATISSKTLSDPVIVNFTCFRWESGKLGSLERKQATDNTKIVPNNPFRIYSLEDTDVECTFNQATDDRLKAGTNLITLSADYNFETSAYQKAYFMDRERQRSMIKENLEPLKEFGITDKTPATVYTNGPVGIAVDIQPLISVSDDKVSAPVLGVLLKNRNMITNRAGLPLGEWEGKIKNIKELVVVLPKGVTIEKPEECKPLPFKPFSGCESSCKKNVLEPCMDVCGKSGKSDSECKKECEPSQNKCLSECNEMFKNDPNGKSAYNAFELDIEKMELSQKKDEFKDIDRFKTFACRLTLIKDELLENTPITTKFIRVKARYKYFIDKSYNVIVEQAPGDAVPGLDESIRSSLEQIKLDDGTKMPLSVLKGLVNIESGNRHCCIESGKNTAGTCRPSWDLNCTDNRILTSRSGSIGIMQINKINAGIANSVCKEGQTIYHRDCNIKVGLEILKRNSKRYEKGAPEATLANFCPEGEKYEEFDMHKLYKNYKGFDAALRAYNGWSCKVNSKIGPSCRNECKGKTETCVRNCIEYTIFYVEKVKEVGRKIENGEINIKIPELDELPRDEESTKIETE